MLWNEMSTERWFDWQLVFVAWKSAQLTTNVEHINARYPHQPHQVVISFLPKEILPFLSGVLPAVWLLEHFSVFVLISDKHAFALQSCIIRSVSAWESAAVIPLALGGTTYVGPSLFQNLLLLPDCKLTTIFKHLCVPFESIGAQFHQPRQQLTE